MIKRVKGPKTDLCLNVWTQTVGFLVLENGEKRKWTERIWMAAENETKAKELVVNYLARIEETLFENPPPNIQLDGFEYDKKDDFQLMPNEKSQTTVASVFGQIIDIEGAQTLETLRQNILGTEIKQEEID